MKSTIIKILKLSPIPLSKNHLYDIQTKKITKLFLKKDSNCIDVGCHKGEILELLLKAAPEGQHFGFEPIPNLYNNLKEKFDDNTQAQIFNLALSNTKGVTSFNYVVSNPSYSGLIKRKYDKADEIDTQIQVNTDLLDNVLPEDLKIDLIKIDVEGGELLVLEGAKKTIARHKPLVIFEHGLGASEFYGSSPEQVFDYFESVGLKISTLTNFLKQKNSMTLEEFKHQYHSKLNYYFIAHVG